MGFQNIELDSTIKKTRIEIMQDIFNWWDSVKRYSKYKPRELKAAIITILVLAFAISFRKWGSGREVDVGYGLINLVGAIVIVALSFFARNHIQKLIAFGADLQCEYRMWSFGLLFTFIVAFFTNGKLWFILPGSVVIILTISP